MAEQMAIEELNNLRADNKRVCAEEYEALKVGIYALYEIQQYRAIGTVEELQALKERLEQYEMAFDLLLKDDCKFAPQGWTGSIDDLYEGRKKFYFNKVKVLRA